jgi:hypothetical protein
MGTRQGHRSYSAGRGSLGARRLANPVTLCDGHSVFFVAVSRQIQMAADTGPGLPGFGGQLERGKNSALRSALRRNAAQQQAQSSTALAFTEFSAATAKPVAVLGRLQGEGLGNTWAEVTWASPDGTAMIIDGAWPKKGARGRFPTRGCPCRWPA